MKNKLIEKAKQLAKTMSTESLKRFVMTCPYEVLNVVLDELEARMPESEFVALCNEL